MNRIRKMATAAMLAITPIAIAIATAAPRIKF